MELTKLIMSFRRIISQFSPKKGIIREKEENERKEEGKGEEDGEKRIRSMKLLKS